MNPAGPLNSKDPDPTREEIRGPDLGPALKRDMVLQRVRAARKRLTPIPNAVARAR